MNKQIPYLFESIVVSSPFKQISISEPNTGRLKVGVFTKYTNRNFSYITDEFAEHLINSAVQQHCPVVGFYDKETNTWASHTGPSLASAYGYVEDFIGWEPFTDSDGVTRDYAVFQIVLHVNYFEEANSVMGQNQSMELDPKTIEGDWIRIEDEEYFAYTKGEMLGFCIIGEHEPCFSSSFFFNKDEGYQTRFEKLSSLLVELKDKVEETENFKEGGEQTMEENMVVKVPVEETVLEENEVATEEIVENENEETTVTEEVEVEENSEEAVAEEETKTISVEEFEELREQLETLQETYEALNSSFNTLNNNYTEIQNSFNEATETISNYENQVNELNNTINSLNESLTTAQATISSYEKAAAEAEKVRKDELVNSYEKLISAEEIAPIREAVADFSYDELESKLAITFSRKQLKSETEKKVPLVKPEDSSFANLIQKYKR